MSFQIGDCRAILSVLPERAFSCCVTSPPYFGLRDYGHEPSIWGGMADCEHAWSAEIRVDSAVHPQGSTGTLAGRSVGKARENHRTNGALCSACGAWRGCLGLEPTPDLYIAHMVDVFRAVRRVLADDATLWLNIGDSYANDGKWGGSSGGLHQEGLRGKTGIGRGKRTTGLKPKDLIGIPWRLALALQADGWWLRSDIIWAKPNPMPESVADRPTKSHEYLFLLSKSEHYFYDAAAIQERASGKASGNKPGDKHEGAYYAGDERFRTRANLSKIGARSARSARSVWTIATEPYSGSHFAVMPTALAARCILAGSRLGSTVLDPFLGSGTVAHVAEQLGRRWFGCDINPNYAPLIAERTSQRGLFAGADTNGHA